VRLWSLLTAFALSLVGIGHAAQSLEVVEGDYLLEDFRFSSGELLAHVRLHYTTLGTPSHDETGLITNAVLLLHGEGETGAGFLSRSFAGSMFGPGQPLDAQRYYVILPDNLGAGRSSKASDELLGRFPRYTYHDMVSAQYRLVLNKLGVNHLRLIIGSAMGGAQTLLWGQAHPYFVDTLLALNCLPAPIAASNDAQRLALVEAAADERVDALVRQQLAKTTALDLSYQLDAARTYDPKRELEKIHAELVVVNFADDPIVSPQLGIAQEEISRTPSGRHVLIRASEKSLGRLSIYAPDVWKVIVPSLLEVDESR
jgi:homoserine O-acetyltransferase/O-succinyltransferase